MVYSAEPKIPQIARVFPQRDAARLAAAAKDPEALEEIIRDLKKRHPHLFRPEALQEKLPPT